MSVDLSFMREYSVVLSIGDRIVDHLAVAVATVLDRQERLGNNPRALPAHHQSIAVISLIHNGRAVAGLPSMATMKPEGRRRCEKIRMRAGCADLRALDPRAPDRAGKDYSGAEEERTRCRD